MFQKKMIMSIIVLMCFYGFNFAQSKTKVGIGIAVIDMQQIMEAQIVYTSIATEPKDGDWEQNLSVINTRVLVFVRFFF